MRVWLRFEQVFVLLLLGGVVSGFSEAALGWQEPLQGLQLCEDEDSIAGEGLR